MGREEGESGQRMEVQEWDSRQRATAGSRPADGQELDKVVSPPVVCP